MLRLQSLVRLIPARFAGTDLRAGWSAFLAQAAGFAGAAGPSIPHYAKPLLLGYGSCDTPRRGKLP